LERAVVRAPASPNACAIIVIKAVGEEFHRAFEIGKEHGDLLPFTFEGTSGGQNLLGQVLRGIGQWYAFLVCSWSRGECWHSRG
jgi:hypothetical protein